MLRIAHFADSRGGRKEEGAKGIQPNAQRRGWYRTWSEWLLVVGRWEEKGNGMDER